MDKDNFLGRWIEGNLSEEELKSFKEDPEYLAYKDILNGVDKFERPVFNVEESLTAQQIFNETQLFTSKRKVIKLQAFAYATAAILILCFGIRALFFSATKVSTAMAETKIHVLPDLSSVTLNADSRLSYSKGSFVEERILDLKGEAFFDVVKGSAFTVNTKNGAIQVLGTEFNVYTRDDGFRVQCFEGKVAVSYSNNDTVILTVGEGVLVNRNGVLEPFDIKVIQPDWTLGKSSFTKVSLSQLIDELERQYAITIDKGDVDTSRLFSGFFTHSDLNSALNSTFGPMGIAYTFVNSKTIRLKNK